MEGFGRNFKFWGWYYCKTDALTALMIVGMVAFMAIFDENGFAQAFSTLLPLYLGMMVVMEVIVFGFTSITVLFPFAVGFGAKRNSCIWAKTLFEHIVFVVNATIAVIAFAWANPEYRDMIIISIPVLIALMGFLMAAGNLVAMFSSRFGRTAGMIIYIIIVALFVVLTIMFMATGVVEPLINTFLYNSFAFGVVIAIVCLALDGLSAYWLLASVKNKDLVFSV